MSNESNWKAGAGALLFVLLATGGLTKGVAAANTHSLDLESDNGQYLSISDGSQTGLDLGNTLTFEAWIKLESQPSPGNTMVIISKYDNTDGEERSYQFRYINDGGIPRLSFAFSDNGSGVSGRSQAQTLSNGNWYHVAATYSGTSSNNRVRFYVNGSQIGSDQDTDGVSSIYNSSAPFYIGTVQDYGSYISYFDGLIDDVRVWNRELSATEIADNMSQELLGNETGLIGYWKLNNSLSDSTNNGNNLTNNGGAVYSNDKPFDPVPPPPPFSEVLKVRKSNSESISNSTSLHSDSQLKLSLDANKTYIIDGVIFLSSTKAKPDAKISFDAESASNVMLGYVTDKNSAVLTDESVSQRIVLPANTVVPVYVRGTVKTASTAGDFQFSWAQATSNAAPTTVLEGSYLRAEEI